VLDLVAQRAATYGESLQPPATPEQLSRLRRRAFDALQVTPPIEYFHFLERCNGLDWDGLTLYAAEPAPLAGHPDRVIGGLIDENLARRALPAWTAYLVFGDTGDDAYCLHLGSNRYCLVDAVSTDEIEAYPSFGTMVGAALAPRV
jgi:hypothetical protein